MNLPEFFIDTVFLINCGSQEIDFWDFIQKYPDKRIIGADRVEETKPLTSTKIYKPLGKYGYPFFETDKKRIRPGIYRLIDGFIHFVSRFFPELLYLIIKKRQAVS